MTTILKGFTKGNRAIVGRAPRLSLSATFSTGPSFNDEDWNAFVANHIATYRRNSLSHFSADRLAYLAERVRAGQMLIGNCFDRNGCLASIMLGAYKGGLFYINGGRSDENLKAGAITYVHFAAMEWAKKHGFRSYCTGPSTPMARGTKSGDIGDFKKRFGGERWDYLAGELILDRRTHLRKILLPTMLVESGLMPAKLLRLPQSAVERVSRFRRIASRIATWPYRRLARR
jgi:hypothetical protein